MRYIVVHGGRSHLDDVMACALAMCRKGPVSQDDGVIPQILNPGPLMIWRRDPTPEELEDPEVLVLDVGRRYEPAKGNFDHHQLERVDCRCAMRLLADHIRIPHRVGYSYPTFAEVLPLVFPWWDTAVQTDQQGPFEAARSHGLEWGQVKPFIGPLAEVWLRQFERETMTPLDRGILVKTTLTAYVEDKVSAYFDIVKNLHRYTVEDVEVLDFTGCDPVKCEDASGVFLPKTGGVAVFIARPRRDGEDWTNTGLTLMRIGDDMRIDFTKVESETSVRFAHKGGFLAQMHGRDMDEAMRLIRIATGKAGS